MRNKTGWSSMPLTRLNISSIQLLMRFNRPDTIGSNPFFLPLSRVAMSANPRQPPMNSSVTLPAEWGRRVRLRRWMETSPQASRRRSRLGCSTAVAGLARHGICSGALVPRRPRHMPRRSSRSLGCAVAARRLLPLSPLLRRFCFAHASRNRKPLRCGRSSLRSRAGWSARLRELRDRSCIKKKVTARCDRRGRLTLCHLKCGVV